MAEETHAAETVNPSMKRKLGVRRGGKSKKKPKQFQVVKERRIDPKIKKFLRKKARDYNSDSDGEPDQEEEIGRRSAAGNAVSVSDDDEENVEEEGFGNEEEEEEEESGEIQPGITKLNEGCRAFRVAFKSIMKKTKKSGSDDPLGPILSVHKQLLAEKLAEEETERKDKGKAKKEKQLVAEKGHVKPEKFVDAHDKFLIGVATKGVVKLFNAVNKAQHAQKGLNPMRSKDAKVIKKRKKEAFFSELGKTPAVGAPTMVHTSSGQVEGEGPSWAPLRDNYMLTNSKLKDWDKMPDSVTGDVSERISDDSSSDDE